MWATQQYSIIIAYKIHVKVSRWLKITTCGSHSFCTVVFTPWLSEIWAMGTAEDDTSKTPLTLELVWNRYCRLTPNVGLFTFLSEGIKRQYYVKSTLLKKQTTGHSFDLKILNPVFAVKYHTATYFEKKVYYFTSTCTAGCVTGLSLSVNYWWSEGFYFDDNLSLSRLGYLTRGDFVPSHVSQNLIPSLQKLHNKVSHNWCKLSCFWRFDCVHVFTCTDSAERKRKLSMLAQGPCRTPSSHPTSTPPSHISLHN